MMNDLEIITTSDGSHTLRNKQLNETYHSTHGAVQESLHVFIKNGLEYYWQKQQVKDISILEVGFGTGLNALLTLQYAAQNNLRLRYTSLEPFPLPPDVWSKLNYRERDQHHFTALHEAGWGKEISLTPEFTILKLKASLQEVHLNDIYDVVYFDAFAPSIQPELWAYEILEKVTTPLKEEGVFVTYSARGQLKRDLKALGLNVETLPGPPGKNEMVRGSAPLG
jgi:Uncharacterized conserved protein